MHMYVSTSLCNFAYTSTYSLACFATSSVSIALGWVQGSSSVLIFWDSCKQHLQRSAQVNYGQQKNEIQEDGLLHNIVMNLSKPILDQCRFGSVYHSSCLVPNTVYAIYLNGCMGSARVRLLVAIATPKPPLDAPSILKKVPFSES